MVSAPALRPSFARSQPEQKNGAPAAPLNVASSERLVSLAGGGILAAYGLSRGSLTGLTLAAVGGGLLYRGLTGHCHLYDSLGIDTAERDERHLRPIPAQQGVKVEESTTILRSPEELYAHWRRFENLPRFMPHLVTVTDRASKVIGIAASP